MRLVSHARRNAIAYLALFFALGGSGYAAGSGTLTTTSHDPGGAILAWAKVSAGGPLISGSRGAFAAPGIPNDGIYAVGWRRLRIPRRCGLIASANRRGSIASALQLSTRTPRRLGQVGVNTYDVHGNPMPAPFTVEVIC